MWRGYIWMKCICLGASKTDLIYIRMLIFCFQVIVPLPSWDLNTKEPLTSDPEKYAIETELIFKYSPFKDEQQLMEQFNKIESSCGKFVKSLQPVL